MSIPDECELKYHIVDIQEVITFWADAYKPKEGEVISLPPGNGFYYDPHQGKVIIELLVKKTDKEPCGCQENEECSNCTSK